MRRSHPAHLRSIGQRLELLGRFRNIVRHAKQTEFVELPTSYSALRGARERVRQNAKTPRAARPGKAGIASVGPRACSQASRSSRDVTWHSSAIITPSYKYNESAAPRYLDLVQLLAVSVVE